MWLKQKMYINNKSQTAIAAKTFWYKEKNIKTPL